MLELDELTAGVPTPRPSPTTAYTEADKIRIMGRILDAWFLCPNLRLGQLLFTAAAHAGEHVSQIKDRTFADAVEDWCKEYR